MKKTIKVVYFSVLKEKVGADSQKVDTNSSSVLEFYKELDDKYELYYKLDDLLFAINDEIVKPDHKINDGDKFVIITPFSGG